jgi:hypothetical protein
VPATQTHNQMTDDALARSLAYFDLKAQHKEQGLPHPAIASPQLVSALRTSLSALKKLFRRRTPTSGHRRASGAKPVRRRGSRRTTAPTRGSPDDPDGDPEPPALTARRQPVTGNETSELAANRGRLPGKEVAR